MEYYTAMKMKTLQLHTAMMTWMNIKNIMLNKTNYAKIKYLFCTIPLVKFKNQEKLILGDSFIGGKIIKQNKEGRKRIMVHVMVNLIHQPGLAMVPRHLVRHKSKSCYEAIS